MKPLVCHLRAPRTNEAELVLFDRDDTLIEDAGQHSDKKKLIWSPGALSVISKITSAGYEIGIVSNQSALAKGLYTENELFEFTAEMNRQCFQATGVTFCIVVVCPHNVTANCHCRKPAAGMLETANNLTKCTITALFGDKISDVKAANNFGVDGVLVRQNNLEHRVDDWLRSKC